MCGRRCSGPPAAPPRRPLSHDVEFHSIHESLVLNRPGMSGTAAECFKVWLTRASYVGKADRPEGHELDGVDLDRDRADRVAAADANL